MGQDALKLPDGSRGAVLDCRTSWRGAEAALAVVSALPHPAELVVQVRRPLVTEGTPLRLRLRASYAALLAGLDDGRPTFLSRLLVAIGCDGDQLTADLDGMSDGVLQRLDRAGLEPVRLTGQELDDLIPDQVHEGRCEVRVGSRLARTLILTRPADGLAAGDLEALAVEHDLSFHARPGRQ